MNKFLKLYIFNSLEVSVKCSHLIPVQRMNNVNFNLNECNVKEENLISSNAENGENSNIVSNPNLNPAPVNSVIFNNRTDYNFLPYNYLPVWSPYYYSANFRYPFIPQTNCYNYSGHPYSNFNYPVWNNYNYHLYSSRQYFHSGLGYQNNSTRSKNFGDKIMSLRTWEKVLDNPGTKPGFIFTLMSYNVLAQDLLEQHPYLYKAHDRQSLIWQTRWNNLFKEISKFKPDILCLQEVQESHLIDYYSILETLGYQSIFKKRTGLQSDGCAIYYKIDNISLIEYNVVEYFQPVVPLMNRDNVGIIMKFAPKMHSSREFVVATTHLLYNPKRDDVRMAQMQLLLAEIDKMSYKREGEISYYLPVLVTGDLNSPPYSGLYDFVTKGSVNYANLSPRLLETCGDFNKNGLVTSFLGITDNSQYQKIVDMRKEKSFKLKDKKKTKDNDPVGKTMDKTQTENSCTNNKKISHNFNLKSVYDHGLVDINEATTYQDEWLTVDYIFYSKKNGDMHPEDKLKLLSRYRLPTSPELNGIRIPNNIIGSDHLSLIAKFKLEF